MNLTLGEAAAACNGELPPGLDIDAILAGVSTDSREELQGKLFIPLKGPNFDGHAYIGAAYAKGAAAALSEEGGEHVVLVKSTLRALADIAGYYRSRFSLPIAAVTGSAGKTTTKDLIAAVLSQRYKTLKTDGNLNNEVGLPRMIFRLDGSYAAAVLEMGMNHAGEIHNLSRIVKPDICVITNIGVAHIENLGSREGILAAKSEIFDCMADDGVCILNRDDDYLPGLALKLKSSGRRVMTYSLKDASADVWACNIQSHGMFRQSCDIMFDANAAIHTDIPLPGAHMVSNALAAAAVGICMGLSPEEIKNGIESFKPSKNRMEITMCGDIELINDVYNANPDSMKAAISILSGAGEHSAAILGDMLELGQAAPEMHYEIGKIAAESGIRKLICVGPLSVNMYEGYTRNRSGLQEAAHYETKEQCADAIGSQLKPGDTVLVKASRGMGLEYIVEILKHRGGALHG